MAVSSEQREHDPKTPQLEVRVAKPSDSEDLGRLYSQLGYHVVPHEMGNRLSELLHDPRSEALVAEIEGRLTGLATLYYVPVVHEAGPWARLTSLVVDETKRGSGIGTALIEASEQAARERGCSRIEATSAFHRSDAHEFYESRGYEQVSAHFLKRLK